MTVGWIKWPGPAGFTAANDQAAFRLSNFDVMQNRIFSFGINNWPHMVFLTLGGAHCKLFHPLAKLLQENVIDRRHNDRSRAGRTFLALIPEG